MMAVASPYVIDTVILNSQVLDPAFYESSLKTEKLHAKGASEKGVNKLRGVNKLDGALRVR